ncbi:DNA repair protein [Grosmannia clavigera kw1407]|uniref:DNA repair protein n=1 Tax=Grosmannia clavigera (strain kw1407 / UAMH 11150) TaxID=655863 RepID=F0XNH0_GROCL|nr:DNA repair protein [Grosmannia clavigera kw1407]EFX00951.1 DNA repair protein [Grosmannia clavigera kw1407]
MPGRTSRIGSDGAGPSQRKRSRRTMEDASVGDEDMEVVAITEASSSLQYSSVSKRVRISDVNEDFVRRRSGPLKSQHENTQDEQENSILTDGGDSGASDDADSEEDAGSVEQDRSTLQPDDGPPEQQAASQYELMRDMGFEHLLHEEEDDMVATQRLQQRAQQNATVTADISGENRRAENGIIERVTCVNFMCHTRLECELGPLLNFIVGENGSGKSAILTAITLCLGAKASATNRGGSLKNFIKEGEERGILAVRIKNCGEDAYEHDVYGDSIIVERHFSKTGTSSFKLKSATGGLISNKRADVDDIVEYYYLQVDNPLNVLSQDNARQFLNSSSASLKYKFFVQGVQLEQLDKDYQLVKQYLDAHDERIPQLEEQVRRLKQNFEEAQKLHKIIQDNQDMRLKKRLYTNQLAWSQVVEQERILEMCEQAVLEAGNNITEAEAVRDAAAQKLEIEDDKLRRTEDTLSTLEAEDGSYKERVERATEEYDASVKELRGLHADERDIHSRLKAAADRAKDLDNKIREEQQRLEDANGNVHREMQARHDGAKQKVEDIAQDLVHEQERLPQLQKNFAAAQVASQKLATDVFRKNEDVRAREVRIRSLEQSRGSLSQYDAFDPRMAELVAMIERDGRFLRKPVGPLGSKVRVQKPIWAPIMEKTFGSALNGFIVTSQDDQQRLSGLIKRLNMGNIPVFIANSRPINTEGKEPDPQFDTILRILEFDDVLVRDQFIINNYIEQVVLVEDRKKAQQVMFNGAVPRNVVACLTLHDKKRGEGLRLTSRGNGNVSTTPVIPVLSQRPRMKTDVGSQIAVQTDILAQNREELQALKMQLNELQQEERRCEAEIGTQKRRLETLKRAEHAASAALRQAEEELDRFDGADGRLQALQEELNTAKQEKDQFGGQYGDVNVKKNQQSVEVEKLKRKLEAEKEERKDFRAKIEKSMRVVEKMRDLRRVALVAKNEAFERIGLLEERKEAASRKRDRQAEQVEDFAKQAATVSPKRVEIPEGETFASVEKKLETLVRQLDVRRRKVGMTDEEASNRVVMTKVAYEKIKDICDVSKEHVQAIKNALVKRLEKWREFQRYISANSRTSFIYLLSERGYRGKLLLDHKNKKLQVQVEPDDTRRTVSGRDTKTLSGGEKSFSSICLLLSIWEAMGSRMRCLDEFDVFMDNVNRDVSTNMLVDAARRSVGRQYIFITPNAIQGSARHAPDVKIIRLTDPRQRTLDA